MQNKKNTPKKKAAARKYIKRIPSHRIINSNYNYSNRLATIRQILGGANVVPSSIRSEMDLVHLTRKGIHASAIASVSGFLGMSKSEMSEKILHTKLRTIQRQAKQPVLDVYKSEQTIEVASVIAKGLEFFRGDKQKLARWLHLPILALGNKKPIELLDTTFGSQLILRELERAQHGVYS